MYASFYGLKIHPFRLAPDARFFYASTVHKHGLAYLRYGIHEGQGFVVVTGKPGIGKSTLVQTLFSELSGRSMVVATLSSTNLNADDVLQSVGHSFEINGEGKSKSSLLINIETFLKTQARRGKRVVLIIDEAHNLPKQSLEELRMLSNFQLGEQPLLQIILLGQELLDEMLASPDMEQLRQRVFASCHLNPLDAADTRAYIGHRLRCAGWRGDPSISGEALAIAYLASHGVPRLINTFCDRLLLAASLEERHEIDGDFANGVLIELRQEASGAFAYANFSDEALVALPPLPGEDFAPAPTTQQAHPPEMESAEEGAITAEPVPPEADLSPLDLFEPADQPIAETTGGVAVETRKAEAISTGGLDGDHVVSEAEMTAEQETTPNKAETKMGLNANDDYWQPPEAEQPPTDEKPRRWGFLLLLVIVAALAGLAFNFRVDLQRLDQTRQSGVVPPMVEMKNVVNEADDERLVPELLPAKDIAALEPAPDTPDTSVQVATETELSPADTGPTQSAVIEESKVETILPLPLKPVEKKTKPPVPPVMPASSPKPALARKNVAEPPHTAQKTPTIAPPIVKSTEETLPQTKAAPLDAVPPKLETSPQATIPEFELVDLVNNLALFYETGDLEGFVSLFSANAEADGAKGSARIRKEYAALFETTNMRQMSIGDMRWQQDKNAATGSGDFSVSVWRKSGGKPVGQDGVLMIEVVRESGELRIIKLSHVVN